MAAASGTGGRPTAGAEKGGRNSPTQRGGRVGPASSTQQRRMARRRVARTAEQIVLLSLAILCGLIGFAVHTFWIASIVLMGLGSTYLVADLTGARRDSGTIATVMTRIGDHVENLTQEGSDSGRHCADPDDPPGRSGGSAIAGDDGEDDGTQGGDGAAEPTKRELYERARRAGIDGRSKMTKEELLESLDE